MTETSEIRRLKTLAKRYARANRIAQHQSLDLIAGQLGFRSWVKLIAASKTGWVANGEQTASIEAFVKHPLPDAPIRNGDLEAMRRRLAYLENAEEGVIGKHAYRLQEALGDVIIVGDGWSVRVPENPGAIPTVETYTDNKDCPVLNPDFLQSALALARDRATRVRAEISTDWPRRSTKPDLDGVVRHPLGAGESSVWYCYHCDGKITGAQIAENLWHCPACGASPLDIFETAFWSADKEKSFLPVETGPVDRDNSNVRIVDGRPKLDLDAEKITLLVRSALLEDAVDVSERHAALQAEIGVDEENDVWIVLDVDLWPEDKEPVSALAVAEMLGIEIDVAATAFTTPFAWPDLGKLTSSTREYTRMMLEAYDQHGGRPTIKGSAQ